SFAKPLIMKGCGRSMIDPVFVFNCSLYSRNPEDEPRVFGSIQNKKFVRQRLHEPEKGGQSAVYWTSTKYRCPDNANGNAASMNWMTWLGTTLGIENYRRLRTAVARGTA